MQAAPIPETLPLFPELDRLLLEVLRGLPPAEWQWPTLSPGWRVHEVALHLLDGSLRTLSMLRDGHVAGTGPASGEYTDVVRYLNALNGAWVQAGQRLSPAVLTWLLELVGPAYNGFLATLDPATPAAFAVAWAGETTSSNHFHVAREYTEKWHHQQQIRQAVGQEEPLLRPELYGPFLATCVQALPHHYRPVPAAPGVAVRLHISGPAANTWFLVRTATGWTLGQHYPGPVQAEIELDGLVAWRLFTKSLPPAEAASHLRLQGPTELTQPIFSLVTVMG
ncbi:maleylpyruvate isomerase N-terminal domain-containing protein [Hymenobacter weizhouensis]|uniref:maleylpyruvate isomerase N-terminal domain-containing protein n=1 Tax=Hymenobacter sp. YIM 151500-1 TaxID=2987689 RepID=UPI002226627A|nr:maleylpyruvate isomerase N-terminal domain-containing protein [Hymenobacter sp. YIM 151500-1]UYZ64111.1 maleylpyruvate isomerase N-terminal domain-containing protein [Hymenobacter sp. YIM 151500-1]